MAELTSHTSGTARSHDIPMLSIHGALSALLHAVHLELEGLSHHCWISYHQGTYLAVEVETTLRDRQAVHDRLARGAIQEDYDYRFSGITWQPTSAETRQFLTAYVDLHHPRAKEGR
jgi:hypothetical protein